MSTITLSKEQQLAVEHFESKLEFETGPVGVANAIKNGERLQIIDLRVPELFAQGHVPGAVNVQYDNLDAYATKLDPHTTTVVYCYNITCNLSAKAALALAKKGLKVKELIGGFEEYAKADREVEKGGSKPSCACS